jgi:hypothetical protein
VDAHLLGDLGNAGVTLRGKDFQDLQCEVVGLDAPAF